MKHVQIIDRAENCAYSIYKIPDQVFRRWFPSEGLDVEFLEDIIERVGEQRAGELMRHTWGTRVDKLRVNRIHGTLFIKLPNKKRYYPTKRESDLDKKQVFERVRGKA